MIMTPIINAEYGGKEKLMEYMRANRAGAFRLHPGNHSYTMSLWNQEELFGFAAEYGVPVFIDLRKAGGVDSTGIYNDILNLALAYPSVNIILLSVGYRHMRVFMKMFEKAGNIGIDTATFITYRGIEEIVKYFGAGRIYFGSRAPFCDTGTNIARIIYADISDKDKEMIACGNAEKLITNTSVKLYGKEGAL
jgi:predicted TIM-barrel fold metal-dependent hydrolase